MHRKRPDVDIIKNLLEALRIANPNSDFVKSLSFQYEERGGLSKKQLQGLLQKAAKVKDLPANWIATLEAEILKRPNRYKSTRPENTPLYEEQKGVRENIESILKKYPGHKRVLFFKAKFDNRELLNTTELAELSRFAKTILA
jgi:hypothetical protein